MVQREDSIAMFWDCVLLCNCIYVQQYDFFTIIHLGCENATGWSRDPWLLGNLSLSRCACGAQSDGGKEGFANLQTAFTLIFTSPTPRHPSATMSKIQVSSVRQSIQNLLKASEDKHRNFNETVELQVGE